MSITVLSVSKQGLYLFTAHTGHCLTVMKVEFVIISHTSVKCHCDSLLDVREGYIICWDDIYIYIHVYTVLEISGLQNVDALCPQPVKVAEGSGWATVSGTVNISCYQPHWDQKQHLYMWISMLYYYLNTPGFTHLLMEGVSIATKRHLSPSHPVYKLLAPHMLFLVSVNA